MYICIGSINIKKKKRIALLFTVLSLPITILPASSPASPPGSVLPSAWVLAMVWAWEGLEPEASPPLWSSSRRWSTRSPAFTSNTSSSLEASSVPGEIRISGHVQTHAQPDIHKHTHIRTRISTRKHWNMYSHTDGWAYLAHPETGTNW